MPDITVLIIFIPTWFLVSISPGLCMSLAMTLGMTIGLKRTLWMMIGEMLGVGLVAVCSVVGVAQLVIKYPSAFVIGKIIGGLYIIYIGINTWLTKVELNSINKSQLPQLNRLALANKGLMTAILNPKGWAFMVSLLPPFFDMSDNLGIQLAVFVGIILISELVSMLIYALGGRSLRRILNKNDKAQWVNRVGGSLLISVGIWLMMT